MDSFDVTSDGPAQTMRIASVVARRLAAGDVVLLKGELAAGKTTFVKAVADALGSPDLVTSPTFTLAQFYSSERAKILHIDTYRLSGVREYRDLGLDEYTETSVSLVEWGEKIADEFPGHLMIEFAQGDGPDMRTLTFSSAGRRWTSILSDLRSEIMGERA